MTRSCVIENLIQKPGDFQQRPVRVSRRVSSQFFERHRIEQLFDSACDLPKTFEYYSQPILSDPLRVITFLRQGASVALDDHRQMKLQSFTDASRSRFADKEISK